MLYQTARDYIADYMQSGELRQKTAESKEEAVDRNGKIVFDLYSGTGTIAQLMAPAVKKVIGVEIVEEAVEAARQNAELNGLHNCEFIAGDVLKVIDTIEVKPDMIILDPPREGIHPKALDKIIRYGVEHILYISCKPTSLVRDLEVFLERGYQVERAVRGYVSGDGECGNHSGFKPHKMRIFRSLEGMKTGGLPPICHRNSEKSPKTLRKG